MRMRRIGYCYSEDLIDACNSLPRIRGRASLCAELIQGYDLHKDMNILTPGELSIELLSNFHSKDYLQTFKELCEQDDPEKIDSEVMEEYGLGYDCPVEEGLFEKCSLIAGASVQAAESLVNGNTDVAINWCGGWHHAKRFEAAGFCYINDIVLAAQVLQDKYERVLYIDLDLHHGDGVEEAFYSTSRVFTLSLHKYSPGFYPGTGRVQDIGDGKGAYYNLNIPLKDGISTQQYIHLFKSVYEMVIAAYNPLSIICQCGADGLAYDEMDSFNLSSEAYVECIKLILDSRLPTLLLGGGGYNYVNTSRTWTLLTACALGIQISNDIPTDIESFMEYKPDFELAVPSGNRPDENKPSEVESLIRLVKGCLERIVKPKVTSPDR